MGGGRGSPPRLSFLPSFFLCCFLSFPFLSFPFLSFPLLPCFLASFLPSYLLTFLPSYLLTFLPSYLLTFLPSYLLTFLPSYLLTFLPSYLLSFFPSFLLSFFPSFLLSFFPSFLLSFFPSFLLSFFPSFLLSFFPSFLLSFFPSFLLSFFPSFLLSFFPSFLLYVYLSKPLLPLYVNKTNLFSSVFSTETLLSRTYIYTHKYLGTWYTASGTRAVGRRHLQGTKKTEGWGCLTSASFCSRLHLFPLQQSPKLGGSLLKPEEALGKPGTECRGSGRCGRLDKGRSTPRSREF